MKSKSKLRITSQNRLMIIFGLVFSIVYSVFSAYLGNQMLDRITKLEKQQKILEEKVQTLENTAKVVKKPEKKADLLQGHTLIDKNLLAAIITIESGWNANAVNKVTGAKGLMQLRKIVYENICGLDDEEVMDAHKNIACGSLFLKHVLNRFHGNIEQSLLYYNNGHEIINEEYDNKVLKEKNKLAIKEQILTVK